MFNTINYLIHKKDKKELDAELLGNFNPFITNKVLSFYKGVDCNYINDTLNTYGNVFPHVEEQFKFFENIIPKLKYQKYEYIKKPKQEEKIVKIIPEFYSSRELDLFDNLSKYNYGTKTTVD